MGSLSSLSSLFVRWVGDGEQLDSMALGHTHSAIMGDGMLPAAMGDVMLPADARYTAAGKPVVYGMGGWNCVGGHGYV